MIIENKTNVSENNSNFLTIVNNKEKKYYPLSSAQKRLYAINQLEGINTTYNMPWIMKIEGKLDYERLDKSFKQLVKRHEVFRTSFEIIEGDAVQKIRKELDFRIEYEEKQTSKIDEIIEKFIKPFDLSKAPLLRAKLLKVSKIESILMIDMHHIISDGRSFGILNKELSDIYNGENNLKKLKTQYKDYAVWQSEFVKKGIFKEQEKYWLDRFDGQIPVLNIPTDFQRPKIQTFKGESIRVTIDKELKNELKSLAKKSITTTYMMLLSAYNLLLYKYSGQEDIIVGIVTPGRQHAEIENIVGMFVNTLPIRNFPEGNKTFKEFLHEVTQNANEAYNNQDYQFDELVNKLKIKRDASRNPIFDTMFVMQNPSGESIQFDGTEISPYKFRNKVSQFDLSISAVENIASISLNVEYSTSLYKKETIERMMRHYINILNIIVDNIDVKIKDIEIITEEEKEEILCKFNDTEVEYPRDKTIQELFEEQVEKTPNKTAVVYGEEELTYIELNKKANQLARVLRKKGVKPDTIVGLMVERSLEMIIGIMGILKAGGAYLPIDPNYPLNRISYILEDSDAKIVLKNCKIPSTLKYNGEVIDLINEDIYKGEANNLELINKSKNLAYILYTSGTTGKPKGVIIEHNSVINRINWMQKKYPINENSSILQKTSFTFDVSVWELFWWSFIGAKVCILEPNGEKNPQLIIDAINRYNVTTIHFVPSMLNIFMQSLEYQDNYRLTSLKQVFASGEALSLQQVNKFNKLLNTKNNTELYNLYGPTEATVDVTYFDCSPEVNINIVPIGKPISNTQIYIVDKNEKLVPIGVEGELCISGEGLARGYLNRPELTKEKFVDNPFIPGERMYKTGDLARWLPDGNIEFIGRIDNQVKIRGYRIEIEEIENQLIKHEDINETVVAAKEDEESNKYLCGYYVSNKEITAMEVREYLVKMLPNYMIPSYFIQLKEIPLTDNGKIDRKGLPEPDWCIQAVTEYVAPRDEIEEKLVQIWQEILSVRKIGINDNFFEIGGHSLKLITLRSVINIEFEVELEISQMFDRGTIKELAKLIMQSDKVKYISIKRTEEKEYYPLSSEQKRMYIVNQLERKNTTYNMPWIMKIEGKLDYERLDKTFKELVKRHESFRTSFEIIEGEVVQKIKREIDFNVVYEEIQQRKIDEKIKEFIQPFDLSKATLLRVKVLNVSEIEHILMIDMHHIISDGASFGILNKELSDIYNGENNLKRLKIQYKDYAVWQSEFIKKGIYKEQEKYWLNIFDTTEIPVLNMPTDYKRPKIQNFNGDYINFEIDNELKNKLNRLTKKTGATMYMLLLSAYNILLSKYTGQEDIIVGTPIAGRRQNELKNIVGMFVNTLAMRNSPESNKAFNKFLKEVKTNSINAYENQEYQFEELVSKLKIKRDASRNPIFDTMFVFESLEENLLELEGLKISSYQIENNTSKFDIIMNVKESLNGIYFSIQYKKVLFKKDKIKKIGDHFIKIISQIVKNPNIMIGEIDMITEDEKEKILYNFNNTEKYFMNKTIVEHIQEQVKKTPHNTAVIYEDKELTYIELNRKSNELARRLLDKNIGKGSIVPILMDHSLEIIISMFAIIKTGAAFTPIDINWPVKRILNILMDINCKLVLVNKDTPYTEFELKKDVLMVDNTLINGVAENICIEINLNNPIYIIFTSGSTGKPKGVIIPHKGITNRFMWMNEYFGNYSAKSILQTTRYVYDSAVWQLLWPLINGGKTVILSPTAEMSANYLSELIKRHKVTMIDFVPSVFNIIVEEFDSNEGLRRNLLSLCNVVIGGEEITPSATFRFLNLFPHIKATNLYGPTEASIGCVYHEIKGNEGNIIPIGKSISNMQILILDKYNNLTPIGIPGEICISGIGVGLGYLNNSELTKKYFIKNPYDSTKSMYRTGDLGKWLPNGNIEFLGRIDQQVKIRGFRIELGAIESKLLEHELIDSAVVIEKRDKNQNNYLCAYIVAKKYIDEIELKKYLSNELPYYMIPLYIIKLDKMLLTSNGKLDKKSLPEPSINTYIQTKYKAPTNQTEEKLIKIWKEVLDVKKIGIHDNFFELGGHSLKIISLITRIHKEFNILIPIKEFFSRSTIQETAQYMENAEKKKYRKIEVVKNREYYPLSTGQKNMYILQKIDKRKVSYNMPIIFSIQGEINMEKVRIAFNQLIQRHDSLRTYFELVDNEPVQKIEKKVNLKIEIVNQERNQTIDEIIAKFIKPFDLSKAPLFRIKLVKQLEKKYYLLMDIHHIISDGISNNIILQEFVKLYKGVKLLELGIQYKDYTMWQQKILSSKEIKRQEKYWLEKMSGDLPLLNLTTDYQRPVISNFKGNSITFNIDKELTNKIYKIVEENNITLYMFLLTTYNTLLYKYTGQEDIIIGSPISGRTHEDVQNIVGMFANTIVIRSHPCEQKTFREFLNEIKENAQEAYKNQDYPFYDLVAKLKINRSFSRNPVFDALFVINNFTTKKPSLKDFRINFYNFDRKSTRYDIALITREENEHIKFSISYNTDLFKEETIQRMKNHFNILLKNISNNLNSKIGEIEILSEEEKHQLLYRFNNN